MNFRLNIEIEIHWISFRVCVMSLVEIFIFDISPRVVDEYRLLVVVSFNCKIMSILFVYR